VCIENRKKENLASLTDYRKQVLYLLDQKPLAADELEKAVAPNDSELFIEVLREMVDVNEIAYDKFWVLHKISS
jgi:hypothetical protein